LNQSALCRMKPRKEPPARVDPGEPVHPEASPSSALAYKNRLGICFYLHEGTTKTGKPRYFLAKNVGKGALSRIPEGFELCESINGVVSVRRTRESQFSVPPDDVAAVRHALERYVHLRYYEVRVVDSAIVIYEPDLKPEQFAVVASRLGIGSLPANYISEQMKRARYAPVMKFEAQGECYTVFRMTYRGHGGWSYPLTGGSLAALVRDYIPKLGTEEFFELM
jgi:hypothetical protein